MTGFVSFLERKQQLLTNATRLKELVQTHLKDQDTSILENFKREVLEDLSFKILCIGDFSSGKSTFINRFLLQENILPAFAKPTTTRPTKIRFGERLKAQLYFQNGEQETITENVAGRLMESVAAGGSTAIISIIYMLYVLNKSTEVSLIYGAGVFLGIYFYFHKLCLKKEDS